MKRSILTLLVSPLAGPSRAASPEKMPAPDAQRAARHSLGGLEWAATIPGTLGGAVYGNAGAFGGDMNGCLLLAEILHPTGKELWPVERMQYQYRSSLLKREHVPGVILTARLKLERSSPESSSAKPR